MLGNFLDERVSLADALHNFGVGIKILFYLPPLAEVDNLAPALRRAVRVLNLICHDSTPSVCGTALCRAVGTSLAQSKPLVRENLKKFCSNICLSNVCSFVRARTRARVFVNKLIYRAKETGGEP